MENTMTDEYNTVEMLVRLELYTGNPIYLESDQDPEDFMITEAGWLETSGIRISKVFREEDTPPTLS